MMLVTSLLMFAVGKPFLRSNIGRETPVSSVKQDDGTVLHSFAPQSPIEKAVSHADGKFEIAYVGGMDLTIEADGTRHYVFPGKELHHYQFTNGTTLSYNQSSGMGEWRLGDGIYNKVNLTVDMPKTKVNAARRLANAGPLSSTGLNSALYICGYFTGPGWCSDNWIWECPSTPWYFSSAECPYCEPSANSPCPAQMSGESCADNCARVHDQCCGGDRRPCNQNYHDCLQDCINQDRDARCGIVKAHFYSGYVSSAAGIQTDDDQGNPGVLATDLVSYMNKNGHVQPSECCGTPC